MIEVSRKFCLNRKPHSPTLSLVSKNSSLLLYKKKKIVQIYTQEGKVLVKGWREERHFLQTGASGKEESEKEQSRKRDRLGLFCLFVCLFTESKNKHVLMFNCHWLEGNGNPLQ